MRGMQKDGPLHFSDRMDSTEYMVSVYGCINCQYWSIKIFALLIGMEDYVQENALSIKLHCPCFQLSREVNDVTVNEKKKN